MPENATPLKKLIVYRLSQRRRVALLVTGIAVSTAFFWFQVIFVMSTLFQQVSYLAMGLAAPSVPVASYVVGGIIAFVLVALVAAYVIGYGWTYRIVLDEEGIAREGWPHVLRRKPRIQFEDIASVTYGTYSVIRVIPNRGRILTVNPRILEGATPGLIGELRSRLGIHRLAPDLEETILRRRAVDRLALLIGWTAIPTLLLMVWVIASRERVLSWFAWQDVGDDLGQVIAMDTGPDGATYILAASPTMEDLFGLSLVRLDAEGTIRVQLPQPPEVFGPRGEPGMPLVIHDMAVDQSGQVWVNEGFDSSLYVWDDESWTRIDPLPGTPTSTLFDLARVGDEIWGLPLSLGAIVHVQIDTGEGIAYGFTGWRDPLEESVEFYPARMYRASDGGLAVSGRFDSGADGIGHFASDGTGDLLLQIDTSVLEAGHEWRIRGGGTDASRNTYAVYAAIDGCRSSDGSLPVFVWNITTGEWRWSAVGNEVPCTEDPSLDSIAVDPRGRMWIQGSIAGAEQVRVYQRVDTNGGSDFGLIRVYARDNSHYMGGELRTLRDGRIVAFPSNHEGAVFIDSSLERLP